MGSQQEPSGGSSNSPRIFTSASAPTAAADSSSGYSVGDKWVVTGDDGVTSGYVYECTDNSVGAAIWFAPQRYFIPPSELPSAINATKIANGFVSNTEFQYLNNVSSNIQTQLDAKATTSTKLDDFATPDDNTDLDATTSRHGLLPKLGGGTSNFLRADGTWAAPSSSNNACCCGVYRTTNISLTTTPTAITFDSELVDTDTIHSTSSNTSRLTIPTGKGGKWALNIALPGSGYTAHHILELYKNGSKVTGAEYTLYASGYASMCPTWVLSASAGDYFEFYVSISSGTGTINSSGVSGNNGGYVTASAVRLGD